MQQMMLFYAAAEAERITRSFRSGNFYSIKKLPTKFAPGGVEDSRKKHIAKTLSNKPSSTYKARITDSYFTPFTYSRTEYNKVKENEREEAQYQRLTTLSFSRKPFTYASSKIRLKNEDLFGDEEYKFPVLGPGKGKLELSHYTRQDFTDASKMIHGPFAVVGPRRGGDVEVSREDVSIWSKEIFDQLAEDWSHLRFSVKFTATDELVVSFDTSMMPKAEEGGYDDRALGRYMITMARHGVAARRRLKKRGDRWRVVEWEECDASTTSSVPEKARAANPSMKQFLVFSFYAPWCVDSHVSAHKGAAVTERLRTRRAVRTRLDVLRVSDRVGLGEVIPATASAPTSSRHSFAQSPSASHSMPALPMPAFVSEQQPVGHISQPTESDRSTSRDRDLGVHKLT